MKQGEHSNLDKKEDIKYFQEIYESLYIFNKEYVDEKEIDEKNGDIINNNFLILSLKELKLFGILLLLLI